MHHTLCILVYIAGLLAQQLGTQPVISGRVVDSRGDAVVGAKVSLAEKGVVLATTETDAGGVFQLQPPGPGAYALVAGHRSFGTVKQPLGLPADADAEVVLTLRVAPFQESVTVSAEAGSALDVNEVAQTATVIGGEQIRLRTRTVLAEVAREEPGLAVQQTSPTIAGINVRGLAGNSVAVYVDGVRYTTSAQRGGINTFLSLNGTAGLDAVEVLHGPNSAQYGSDSLGGTVSVVTQTPALGSGGVSGEASLCYSSPSYAWGSSLLLSYGGERWAWLLGGNGIRSSNMRPAGGLDSHAAVTRFLGLPSDVFGTRPSDTAFTQYGGRVHVSYLLSSNDHLAFSYTRSQQDAGKRYDQLLGGDGNLKADLRNLMLDFGYIRYLRTDAGWFDSVLATTSFNSQREERVNQGGQGDPLGTISTQFERTTVLGASVQAEKLLAYENRLLLGADFATEWVDAPAHVYDPRTGAVRPGRPRIPDGARYTWAGAFAQDGWETLAGKIRLTGAVRVGATNYHVDESPISSGGRPLFPADRLASVDFSARVGAVLRPTSQITIASSWARGYRAPSVTDLGTLGVTGDGYEISAPDVAGLGATVGSTAADDAQDTGIPVTQLGDQTSNSLDVGVRLRFDRWGANITAYRMVLDEVITKQALILPDGAVGVLLGSEPVVAQGPTGVVYVAASPAPVLVRENFGAAIYRGIESDLFVDVFEGLRLEGVFSMVRAEDSETALPPNIEGGVPPANGSLTLTWEPHPRLWLGGWALLADEQTRLSSLDLSDRRSGATRSRDSIAAFFDRGARVRGLVGAGPDGIAHTVDDVLNHTGETLADVQWRVLGSAQRAPLFAEIPGYGIFGARVGWRMAERHDLYVDFENLADKCYRGVAWGVDGRGRGVTVKYRWRF